MLSYIKLRNFKCFSDITFDLRGKRGKPKQMIFIYGENGSGKTNLMNSMKFLMSSLDTITNIDLMKKLNDDIVKSLKETESDKQLFGNLINDFIRERFTNLEQLISDHKMIGSAGDLSIEIGFYLDGKEGSYSLTFDDSGVTSESLISQINNRRGLVFSLSDKEVKLSPSVFFANEYKEELQNLISKYWGKHTFLSIIMNELDTKNEEFINNNIGNSFLHFFSWITQIWLSCKSKSFEISRMGYHKSALLRKLEGGTISQKSMKVLEATEVALNSFYPPLYSDIKRIFYKIEDNGDKITYNLFVTKILNNNLVDIPFNLESTGTMKLLDLFPFIMGTLSGNTIMVDEIDSGIHDILIKEIVGMLQDSMDEIGSGQFIGTTHNTLLMDHLPKECVYIINCDPFGNRSFIPIEKYDFRTHSNNSIRSKYLSGSYSGVPITGYIDFTEIADTYNESIASLSNER